MAKITKLKYSDERIGNGVMKTAETADVGTILATNADGLVEEINDTVNFVFAGISKLAVGDTGEPETPVWDYGAVFFYPTTAAQTDVGQKAFASGLGTIAISGVTNDVYVGKVVDVEVGAGWWIDPLAPNDYTV